MYFKHNTANIQNIGKRLPNSLKFVITRVGTILFIAIFIGCILVFIPRRRLKEQKETIEDRLGELLSSKADQVEDGVEKVYEVVDNLRDELLRKQGYRARYKPMPKWPEAGKLLEGTNEKLHDEVLEKHVTTTKTSSSESTTTTSPSTSTTEKKTRKVYKDPNNPFAPFGYNVTVSDSIPIDRKLNDIRIQECKDKKYRDPSTYPKVSIVMSLYNEAWSTLLRTISSIMLNTPLEPLEEILIVDDISDEDDIFVGPDLPNRCKNYSVPVRYIRTPERTGFVKARILGAKEAKGEIIISIDPHSEVTPGWFEPLIDRLIDDPKRIVVPIHDGIDPRTFQHYPMSNDRDQGGFGWLLSDNWEPMPKRKLEARKGDPTLPWDSPTLITCAYGIWKKWFFENGALDGDLYFYGGSDVEFGLRTWMCGGNIENLPCSHVGHIFKAARPFNIPGGDGNVIYRNIRKMAEVFADDWLKFLVAYHPPMRGMVVGGDIAERKKLRADRKCHSFQWYLDNVYPESMLPREYRSFGMIRNPKTDACIDSLFQSPAPKTPAFAQKCWTSTGAQYWSFTRQGRINNDIRCLSTHGAGNDTVMLHKCNYEDKYQAWHWDEESSHIVHNETGRCLTMKPVPSGTGVQLNVLNCGHANFTEHQVWETRNVTLQEVENLK